MGANSRASEARRRTNSPRAKCSLWCLCGVSEKVRWNRGSNKSERGLFRSASGCLSTFAAAAQPVNVFKVSQRTNKVSTVPSVVFDSTRRRTSSARPANILRRRRRRTKFVSDWQFFLLSCKLEQQKLQALAAECANFSPAAAAANTGELFCRFSSHSSVELGAAAAAAGCQWGGGCWRSQFSADLECIFVHLSGGSGAAAASGGQCE